MPEADAMMLGPDMAICVFPAKRRCGARCASMLEPPKQLRPSTAAIGAPENAAPRPER